MIKRWWMITGLVLLVLVGCTSQTEKADQGDNGIAIKSATVERADFPVTLQIGGTLEGQQQTTIYSKVIATVDNIPVSIGQKVKKGDLLVAFDRDGVQSQYRQTEANFLNARNNYRKTKALYEAGAVSETDLDGVETQFKVAEANFQAARQAVDIIAPFDGVVVDIPVNVGDEVATGMPVVEVAIVSALRVVLDVPTSVVGKLAEGQNVRVESPFDSTLVMTGRVIDVADAANPVTRSFEVECLFDNPPSGFSPGMYVIADIRTRLLEQALIVDNDAFLYRSGKTFLYKIVNDTVQMVEVEITADGQNRSAVSGPLQAGDRIVVVGHKNLAPGAAVREAAL